ncbi:MAG TPA: right-handed parallel beta-helix repeat-containing protein [Chthoniobacterales bacterium]|nr:right-handed parallel beta-helix repeat-containing protein [Chthoniobacterales bacterium]
MITSKIIRFFSTAALVVGFSTVVHAQATRTWVSGVGDDVNPCSRTAPCKTFAGAISKTANCGEISVLDPGGFGAVTITKGITINGTGTLAGILAANVNGVIVNATANDTVILRDISINGACNGLNGIRYIGGKVLMVDHCWIYGFRGNPGRGIDVAMGVAGKLKVIDSVIENILEDGVHINMTAGQLTATIDKTRIMNCDQDGIDTTGNVRGAFSFCLITHNTTTGVKASATNSLLNIDDTQISFSSVGLQSIAGSAIRVSDSIIAQNATGLNPNGGTIDSFQGNSLIGNTAPGAFSSTTNKQ